MFVRALRESGLRTTSECIATVHMEKSKNKLHLVIDACAVVRDLLSQRILYDYVSTKKENTSRGRHHVHLLDVLRDSPQNNPSVLVQAVCADYSAFICALHTLAERLGHRVSLVLAPGFSTNLWALVGLKARDHCISSTCAPLEIWCDPHVSACQATPAMVLPPYEEARLISLIVKITSDTCTNKSSFSLFHCNEGGICGILRRAADAKSVTAYKNFTTVLCSSDPTIIGAVAGTHQDVIVNLVELLALKQNRDVDVSRQSFMLLRHDRFVCAINAYCRRASAVTGSRSRDSQTGAVQARDSMNGEEQTDNEDASPLAAPRFSVPHMCALLSAADDWWTREVAPMCTVLHDGAPSVQRVAVAPDESTLAFLITAARDACAAFPELCERSLAKYVPAPLVATFAQAVKNAARDLCGAHIAGDPDEEVARDEDEENAWLCAVRAHLNKQFMPSPTATWTTLVDSGESCGCLTAPAIVRMIVAPCHTAESLVTHPSHVLALTESEATPPVCCWSAAHDALMHAAAQRRDVLMASLALVDLGCKGLYRALCTADAATASPPHVSSVEAPPTALQRMLQRALGEGSTPDSLDCLATFYEQQQRAVTSLIAAAAAATPTASATSGTSESEGAALIARLWCRLPLLGVPRVCSTARTAAPAASAVTANVAYPLLPDVDRDWLRKLDCEDIHMSLLVIKVLHLLGFRSAASSVLSVFDVLSTVLYNRKPHARLHNTHVNEKSGDDDAFAYNPPHTEATMTRDRRGEFAEDIAVIRRWLLADEVARALPACCQRLLTTDTALDEAQQRERRQLAESIVRRYHWEPMDLCYGLLFLLDVLCGAFVSGAPAKAHGNASGSRATISLPMAAFLTEGDIGMSVAGAQPSGASLSTYAEVRLWSYSADVDFLLDSNPTVAYPAFVSALHLPPAPNTLDEAKRRKWHPEHRRTDPTQNEGFCADVCVPGLDTADLTYIASLFEPRADMDDAHGKQSETNLTAHGGLDPLARALMRRVMLFFEECPHPVHTAELWIKCMLFLFGPW